MNITYLWLLAGVAFVAAEALGLPGVGMLFAGLGAITVGGALFLGMLGTDAQTTQFSLFFITTAIYALLLWKPLQKMRIGKPGSEYRNIVGETAYVGASGLDKHSGGEVTWSGTIMKAQLAKGTHTQSLEAGSQVVVVELSGATLIVKPKE